MTIRKADLLTDDEITQLVEYIQGRRDVTPILSAKTLRNGIEISRERYRLVRKDGVEIREEVP